MNITTTRKQLLAALRTVAVAAQSKGTMPILSCVLLDASDGLLRLACTDLFRSAATSVPADVAQPGSVAVDAAALLARVDAMPEGPVALSAVDDKLTLRAARRTHTLHAIPGTDFPEMPKAPTGEPVDLRPLADAVRRVAAAVSPDETRTALNSLYVVREDDGVVVVATDGHRLHMARTGLDIPAGWLVPRAFVKQLVASCAESTRTATGASSLALATGDATHATRLVDGTFPPYSQVIPKDAKRTATIARAALVDALRSVSLAASDRTGGVRLTFDADQLAIAAESPETGDSADVLDAVYDGPRVTVGVNAHYLLDALAGLDGDDDVQVGFASDLDPLVVRGATNPAAFVAVVMPMRI